MDHEELKQWVRLKLAENEEYLTKLSKETDDIKSAIEKLNEIYDNPDGSEEIEVRKKAILDYINQMSGARREGLIEGFVQGLLGSYFKGSEDGALKAARLSCEIYLEKLFHEETLKFILNKIKLIEDITAFEKLKDLIFERDLEGIKSFVNKI